jgi:agmatinase
MIPPSFDPNAAASEGAGIFGLPFSPAESRLVIVPVPFEATTSYGGGTSRGPEAVLEASKQVDLFDAQFGRPYEAGIAMLDLEPKVAEWNERAKRNAEAMRAALGKGDRAAAEDARRAVDDDCERLNAWLHGVVREQLTLGKIVGTLGGDHGAIFGAIAAHAERHPNLGILHFDAHADLRRAYEGFTWSHASIMDNVSKRLLTVNRLVQVGIRDFCEDESIAIEESNGRIRTYFDADLAAERFEGATWRTQVSRIIADLPESVYVSFDIDGLDPTLCPHTGTPVAGGQSFHEAAYLLGKVVESGRTIVGFDLVEVAPGPDGDEWDANVGARMLYKLIGATLASRERARR